MTRDAPERPRGIVICADDYGLTPGVSRGILEVAEAGRVSAVSAMTASRYWPDAGPALRALAGRVDLGLHLTLTDLEPAGAMPRTAPAGRLPPLARLLRAGILGALDLREIGAEIDRQIGRFVGAVGRPPDFVDGHQHAHLVPGVRGLLIARLAALPGPSPYLRDCHEPAPAIVGRGVAVPKAVMVATLARGLGAAAKRAGIATNDSFRGVLDYGRSAELPEVMRRFLCGAGQRAVVMCHPGVPDAALEGRDRLVAPRARELAYLESEAFLADLGAAGCRPARFAECG